MILLSSLPTVPLFLYFVVLKSRILSLSSHSELFPCKLFFKLPDGTHGLSELMFLLAYIVTTNCSTILWKVPRTCNHLALSRITIFDFQRAVYIAQSYIQKFQVQFQIHLNTWRSLEGKEDTLDGNRQEELTRQKGLNCF